MAKTFSVFLLLFTTKEDAVHEWGHQSVTTVTKEVYTANYLHVKSLSIIFSYSIQFSTVIFVVLLLNLKLSLW